MSRATIAAALAVVAAAVFPTPAFAQESANGLPSELRQAGITEKLGHTVPAATILLRDEQGAERSLQSLIRPGKPVILAIIYYECPNLCNLLLNGLVTALRKLDWVPGQEFDIVLVSMDPREKSELAAKKKAAYLDSFGRPESGAGWHFLTGDEKQINSLANEIGFGYHFDEKEKQYAHSAALFVLTPGAKISRILYGVEFKPRDLRLALLEAASGKIGSVVDRFLLFCYRYDPNLRSYSVYLFNVMRVAGLITAVAILGSLAVVWSRQRRPGGASS